MASRLTNFRPDFSNPLEIPKRVMNPPDKPFFSGKLRED